MPRARTPHRLSVGGLKNLKQEEDFTARYTALLDHYGISHRARAVPGSAASAHHGLRRGRSAGYALWHVHRGILYSAPSRLIGHRLKVRLYSDRLDCYLSGALVLTLARGVRSAINGRDRMIDYRHCMTAAMLVLDPIFEADLPPEQYANRRGGA